MLEILHAVKDAGGQKTRRICKLGSIIEIEQEWVCSWASLWISRNRLQGDMKRMGRGEKGSSYIERRRKNYLNDALCPPVHYIDDPPLLRHQDAVECGSRFTYRIK
jgi:hypothetical protein